MPQNQQQTSGKVPTAGAGRAVLLIDCPDRKGLVARVASLLYDQGANVLHADQHQDHELGLFFMRVEWALESGASSTEVQTSVQSSAQDGIASFTRAFTSIAQELQMRWQLHLGDLRPRVVLFCSQYLHCRSALPLKRRRTGLRDRSHRLQPSPRGKARRLPRFPL
jgi:formyltetrahydrofolate deformylase